MFKTFITVCVVLILIPQVFGERIILFVLEGYPIIGERDKDGTLSFCAVPTSKNQTTWLKGVTNNVYKGKNNTFFISTCEQYLYKLTLITGKDNDYSYDLEEIGKDNDDYCYTTTFYCPKYDKPVFCHINKTDRSQSILFCMQGDKIQPVSFTDIVSSAMWGGWVFAYPKFNSKVLLKDNPELKDILKKYPDSTWYLVILSPDKKMC